MQNKSKRKSTLKNAFISVLLGLIIVSIAFQLSARYDMNEAYSVLDNTTAYIKEQCNRYSLIRLSSESKSLTRLTEGCKNIRENLSLLETPVTEKELKEYVRANYLTGVILADEKGNITAQYSKDENTNYLSEEYLKNESLSETALYPNKQYAVRYPCENGDEVDIAAVSRIDAPGIIIAYYHTPKDYKESFSLNVEALLEGFTMEKSGTIVVSDGNTVIASNNESYVEKKPSDIAVIDKIHHESPNNKVVAARESESTLRHSYGLMKQGRDVFVYAFMPENEIYSNTPFTVLITLAVYALGVGLLNHTKAKAAQGYREQQLKLREEYAESLEAKNIELQDAVDKANRANRAKSAFLSRMSHDIRTPINGIVGLIKINKDHFLDKELVLKNFDRMQVAADHLLSLINDVLQMSKIEDGTTTLTHERVNLRAMFYDVTAIIEERAAEDGIAVQFIVDETKKHPDVYGSPVHLRQIFLNIYTNSVKYNNPGGKIVTTVDVETESENKCVYKWTIEDTGVGMSEEYIKHIFEPFTQERNDARTSYRGVGLGMSIVKGLIDQMGGEISVSSKVGEGTTFVITIPFEIAQEDETGKAQIHEDASDLTGFNLMLVEDNDLNAEIAEFMLGDLGASITRAENGSLALDMFESNPENTFDAILMDIMMPVMDGISATKKIRALSRPDAKTIPIIAMTANAFAEDANKCIAAGMNAHLSKPLEMDKVIKTIKQYCKK